MYIYVINISVELFVYTRTSNRCSRPSAKGCFFNFISVAHFVRVLFSSLRRLNINYQFSMSCFLAIYQSVAYYTS